MTSTTPENKPYLGKCGVPGCGFTFFSTAEDLLKATSLNEVKPGHAYLVDNDYGKAVFSRCTSNHKVFRLKQIKGTYSEDHKCDSRCMNARGNECTCSCGGANHGRGHAVVVHEAGKQIEERYLGEPGGKPIKGKVRVVRKTLLYTGTTLCTFITLDETAKLIWFAPEYVEVPDFEPGDEITIRARVKEHNDHPQYGKQTIITHVEQIVEQAE